MGHGSEVGGSGLRNIFCLKTSTLRSWVIIECWCPCAVHILNVEFAIYIFIYIIPTYILLQIQHLKIQIKGGTILRACLIEIESRQHKFKPNVRQTRFLHSCLYESRQIVHFWACVALRKFHDIGSVFAKISSKGFAMCYLLLIFGNFFGLFPCFKIHQFESYIFGRLHDTSSLELHPNRSLWYP